MKVITPGTEYVLEGFGTEQTVRFTSKAENGTFLAGTTNEEVVNMLIERFYYLNNKNYSSENSTILIQLKSVRALLKKRINKKIKKAEQDGNKSN